MGTLVSVIMPVYNASAFVSSAIESVINQTFKNWELIIVNDGSTDSSEKEILKFKDSRICYFSKPRGGVSKARNFGLQRMKGDYFCFLDADDVLPERSIESRLAVFNNEKVDFADGVVQVFDVTMTNHLFTWAPSLKGKVLTDLLQLGGKSFFGPTWLIKVKPKTDYHFQETLSYGEDLYFYIALAANGVYSYTEEPILLYRKHSGSAMRNIEGLAHGYTTMYHLILQQHRHAFRGLARLKFSYRSRKIIFLEFFRMRRYRKALQYLLTGTIS